MTPPSSDDQSPPPVPRAAPLPAPTRLEMAREIEALRLAVRERESWLDELRRELEERDASYGWKDQEARTAVAEAAAARRETAQYQEDRDHVRKQLHAQTEELALAAARVQKLEAEVGELRLERRRRKEEMVELRAKVEAHGELPSQTPAGEGTEGLAALRAELEEARAIAATARDTMTGLADELAASQDDAQVQSTAANALRAQNIDLLQRVNTQGEELAGLRAELDQLRVVLAEERRDEEARLQALNTELAAAHVAADKSAELRELAAAHEELAALRAPWEGAAQPDLAARDARLATLERALAEEVAQVAKLSLELQELRDRGFARYLESP